ncbi:BMC domain-containing protein [Niallia hominis]|uniref:BMC domain-containing protein n=1 Tax=Niallia hominis TaxID=3133173 RepID=A0ABV1EY82_9BACI
MKASLGMIEVKGFVLALEIADIMSKTAAVQTEDLKITRGSGWVTVCVYGNVGAVNAAISAGKQQAVLKRGLISARVIARPIDNIFGKKNDIILKDTKVHKSKESIEKEQSEPPKVKGITATTENETQVPAKAGRAESVTENKTSSDEKSNKTEASVSGSLEKAPKESDKRKRKPRTSAIQKNTSAPKKGGQVNE